MPEGGGGFKGGGGGGGPRGGGGFKSGGAGGKPSGGPPGWLAALLIVFGVAGYLVSATQSPKSGSTGDASGGSSAQSGGGFFENLFPKELQGLFRSGSGTAGQAQKPVQIASVAPASGKIVLRVSGFGTKDLSSWTLKSNSGSITIGSQGVGASGEFAISVPPGFLHAEHDRLELRDSSSALIDEYRY